jgi:hypothetical protein
MLRNTQEFEVNGKALTVLKAHGPIDLARCLDELRKFSELQKDADLVAKFQKNSTHLLSNLPFFKSKSVDKSAQKASEMQAVLYTNGPQQLSLIVTDGKDHYFYDLVRGAAASFDVKEALGSNFTDVSRDESRMYLEKTHGDVGQARELSQGNLPNLQAAVTHAMEQIKVAQRKKAVQPEHEQSESNRTRFGSSAGG